MTGDRLFVRILGCGSSPGVPRVGNQWGACDPREPKNRRRRCGLLVERRSASGARTTLLIDTPPDLREQLLDADVQRIDAIAISHEHADQTHGIDDVRPIAVAPIPVFMDPHTAKILTARFAYIFEGSQGYPAVLDLQAPIVSLRPFVCHGAAGPLVVTPIGQDHGPIQSYGFRIGPVAYSNDVVAFPSESFDALRGLNVWVVDAARFRPHPTHAHVDLALAWIEELKPRRSILTNMSVEVDYHHLSGLLPPHVEPAYDGLEFELEYHFP